MMNISLFVTINYLVNLAKNEYPFYFTTENDTFYFVSPFLGRFLRAQIREPWLASMTYHGLPDCTMALGLDTCTSVQVRKQFKELCMLQLSNQKATTMVIVIRN